MNRAAFRRIVVVLFSLCGPVVAEEKREAVTDPQKADDDFAVQGEYAGDLATAGGRPKKHGVQVIALGDHKFHMVLYPGGLPGAGWDKSKKDQADGETNGQVTTFRNTAWTAAIKDYTMRISAPNGDSLGELKRTARTSPTLGKEPPSGAVVLFGGTSADEWEGGRMSDDRLLMAGATSKKKFGSYTLHIEFRIPYMPHARGQERGNSGCYMQGRYEVQVLDSFGLDGKENECGGIYSVRDPDVNMCLPPLAWQTYDIDYTAAKYEDGKKVADARATVRHNGVVVHNDAAIPHATTAAPLGEGPEPGPIFLQNHGNPVRFRNIWLVEKE